MKSVDWLWPNNKRIAVVFNVCLEQWSDGKAPGISPMGNPLPAGVLDTMAISWAAYGLKTGIYRLLESFKRHGAKTSVMVNAVCAERAPEAVKAIADGGHEVLSHSYAMDVVPALLSDEDEKKNIERCTRLLEKASGQKIQGWLSPRGTSKPTTPRLLADFGYRWYGDVFDADLPYVQTYGDKKIVAIPLSYDVNDMPSMKYGHPPKMMLDSFNEVIDIARSREDELRIIDVTNHAHIFGHHRGAYYFEKIIEKAMSRARCLGRHARADRRSRAGAERALRNPVRLVARPSGLRRGRLEVRARPRLAPRRCRAPIRPQCRRCGRPRSPRRRGRSPDRRPGAARRGGRPWRGLPSAVVSSCLRRAVAGLADQHLLRLAPREFEDFRGHQVVEQDDIGGLQRPHRA